MESEVKHEFDEDLIEDIQILSGEQYDVLPPTKQEDLKSNNSSQEYAKIGQDLTQQQKFVQAKYQKYKKLRKKLQQERMNLPENKSVSDSYSSFSGSSLSSGSDSSSQDEISKQTFDMIFAKFQKMQQPRASQSDQPITLKKISDEHDVDIEFLQNLFERWKKAQKEKARAEQKKAKQQRQARFAENGEKEILLVPTESMLNIERAKTIEQLINENPYITQNQIYLELNKISTLKSIKNGKLKQINRTLITKLLTEGPFKQTRLRVLHPDRNQPRIVEIRHFFCKEFLKRYNKGYSIVFLDEHNFQLFQTRDCMWVRPDLPNKLNQTTKKHQFSLLAAFDMIGGAYWKISNNCSQKYDDYEGFKSLFEQSMEVMEEHETSLSKKGQDGEQSRVGRKICLVMDGQIVNNPQKLKRYQEIFKSKVLLLPQFSVQLNPIEEWFQQLRLRIRTNSYSTNEQLLCGVHNLLREYQTFDYKPFIEEALKHIERGYKKDRF